MSTLPTASSSTSPFLVRALARCGMPAWYAATVLVFALLAAVPTLWPALDLGVAGAFRSPGTVWGGARDWWWVVLINDHVPSVFRAGLALAALGWLLAQTRWALRAGWQRWRLPLAFVAMAGVLGPGLVVNWVVKDQWQRARPYQVTQFGGSQQFSRAGVMTDQCQVNCSFVSGHVACGAFFIGLGLVLRRRMRWLVGGAAAGLCIGFARMAASGHWLSDVLWAFPVTLLSSWLVWRVLCWLYARPSRTVG